MAATLDEAKAAFKKRYEQGAAEVSRRYPLARDHVTGCVPDRPAG